MANQSISIFRPKKKLSMVWNGSRAGQTKKLPKNECGDYAFREKKLEFLLICRSDYMLTRWLDYSIRD